MKIPVPLGLVRSVLLVAVALCLFLAAGCAAPPRKPPPRPGHPPPYQVFGEWYQPMKHSDGYRERGMASWYGKEFHGRKTSNGEIYDMYAMTAAHKTLPLGTYVQVRNLRNDKQIEVRINDRGPFVRGRIIDLSYAGAQELGLVGPGTAPVEVVALGTPLAASSDRKGPPQYVPGNYYVGNFSIQVGAFKDQTNAVMLRTKLASRYQDAHIVEYESNQGTFYRVRAARCTNLEEARRYEKMLEEDGFPDAMVVAE